MDATNSMMLTYSWFKFIDMLLLIVCIFTYIQICNVEIFVPETSSLCAAFWCVLSRVLRCTTHNTSSTMHGM